MTFEWEDITDEVLKKVVLVQYYPNPTSGFADCAGSITAITEDGQEYKAGFERTSRNKEVEILKLFWGELPKTSFDGAKFTIETEKWRWTEFWDKNIFIRKDFFDKIYSEWKKQREDDDWISPTEAAKKLLDPQDKLPRMVLSETRAIWDDEEKKRREHEEWREKTRLVEGEDYEWKEFESGFERGNYLLLFKENEDGGISGSRWTIVFQREQFEEGGFKSNAPVEAYNLY